MMENVNHLVVDKVTQIKIIPSWLGPRAAAVEESASLELAAAAGPGLGPP